MTENNRKFLKNVNNYWYYSNYHKNISNKTNYFTCFIDDLLPITAFTGELLLKSNNTVDEKPIDYFYGINKEYSCNPTRSYQTLVRNFVEYNTHRVFYISKTDSFISAVKSSSGLIFDEDSVLMILAIDKDYFIEVRGSGINLDVDFKFDKFKIFLSNKLLIPEYKSLYTAINKYVLDSIRQLDFDIDIVYVNNIEKRLYKETPVEFNLPKFKSLGEMKTFLNNLYKEL